MPFKKVDVKKEVEERISINDDFKKSYEQIDKEYELIKEIVSKRKELGLSQNIIAERSGLKQQVISRIETEGNSPTLKNLIRYLDALDLTIKIEDKNKSNKSTPCIY
ncbi:helix-turn-helix transcriptional regulator [Sedimentibacter sp.]|uniref:helix-turn-helix domain-containing protein n=1 Tax=Sedimentibacter sp. TaxID=1960295 RepID=UPI00289CD962|nr:helix-turn-helix transcriptional regulator [Sedimentibacter sp.]